MPQPTLLSSNGTPLLRAFEQATAYETRLAAPIDLIPGIKGRQLPGWLEFLLYEYGLLELTPYVPNPYTLLSQGRDWQIERDTFAAVARGLGWVGAPGTIVEAPARRKWWNSFQLYLNSLPLADAPNLERIDKVTSLSSPYRSDFRRGVWGYDVPPLEGDETRLDGSLLDIESGVRIRAGGPLWSFGRVFEFSHVMTETEGLALGNWLPTVAEAAYFLDLIALAATVDDETVPFEDATNFSRASVKWHDDLAGAWHRFEVDEIATTDRGSSIEVAGERLSTFSLAFNPLEDVAAATVDLINVADPFGGNDAIRVTFDGDAGNILYVPAQGLSAGTYSVSFLAKLIGVTGDPTGGESGPGFTSIFGQLVTNQWVRVKGPAVVVSEIEGQWFDLTLNAPGATLTVDLFGFQIEPGAVVTSPIEGDEITGARAADHLTLNLPVGLNNVVVNFDNGHGQSFLEVVGPYSLNPASLDRPLVVSLGNLSAATWQSMSFPWSDADFPWNSDAVAQRAIQLASWFHDRNAYFAFKNGAGAVIGYRRARLVRQVSPDFNGPLTLGGTRYKGSNSGQSVFIEAMTDAGNGVGQQAATVSIIFGAERAPGIPPGRLWLAPNELIGGEAIAAGAQNIPLRATVRERVKTILRF